MIVSQISWLSLFLLVLVLICLVACVYLTVICFTNRSSIEFIKQAHIVDQNAMSEVSHRLRAVEAKLDKRSKDRIGQLEEQLRTTTKED